jgi:hypothetical protein
MIYTILFALPEGEGMMGEGPHDFEPTKTKDGGPRIYTNTLAAEQDALWLQTHFGSLGYEYVVVLVVPMQLAEWDDT